MKIISYLFWKNVYHNYLLYRIAWIYFFCFNSQFRAAVRLERACRCVESQDAFRVDMAEIRQELKAIADVIRDLMSFMAIVNNQKAISK